MSLLGGVRTWLRPSTTPVRREEEEEGEEEGLDGAADVPCVRTVLPHRRETVEVK